LKPLRLGDRVQAEVWLSELSLASAWMEFRFENASLLTFSRAEARDRLSTPL
jgi:hypothetical protein